MTHDPTDRRRCPAASARPGSSAGCRCRRRPADDHRRRQHRRRHRTARAGDLARPRHDRLHARRRDRSRTRLGPRRRDVAGDGALARYSRRPAGSLGGDDVVPPRRPRPRHPPVPHGPPRPRGPRSTPVAAEIRRAWDVAISIAADDRRSRRPRWSSCRRTAARSRSRTTSCACTTSVAVTAVRFERRRRALHAAARRDRARPTWS